MLIGFVVYAAFAAFMHELIVGISAMHAGWFHAFAVALITLIIVILLGFPPIAVGLLVGFSAWIVPAYADIVGFGFAHLNAPRCCLLSEASVFNTAQATDCAQ